MPKCRHFFALGIKFAPLCWAVMAAIEAAKAVVGSILKTMSFSTTPTEAEAIKPISLIIAVMMRKEILTRPSCRAMGRPTLKAPKAVLSCKMDLYCRYLAK